MIEKIIRLEPSPLYQPSLEPFRVTYQLPSGEWHCHNSVDWWSAWWLCKTCAELDRPVRIQEKSTGRVYGTEVALLNLFSNRLSGRSQEE